MATQQGMSGIDLHAMVSELHARLPFWMGKSYQYDNKTFGIRLNGENKEKYNLIIELGRRAHFTEFLPPSPPNPSGYSMFLRKYLSGGRVLDVRQHGLERIIDITVGKSETQFHIIIELFDEGNIILCDREYLIIQPFSRRHFKNREIISGVRYVFPIEEYSRRSPEEVEEILAASDRDLVRTLATGLMLGGRYAEEVCTISGFDKNIDPLKADAETISQTYNEIVGKSESSIKPQISETGCWPFHLSGEKQVHTFETFNEALDAFFPKTKKEIKEVKPKLSKEEIIRKRQADAIVGFEAKIEHFEAIVELIYSNYQVIADVIHTLDSASKTYSWQEIEAIVKNSDLPSARL
ncbi:MAG: NFACT family protein, partial [Euryarchaeota archaeon]|nr:NFACT family protein [Euryarchaeota archaeon]